MSNLPQYAEPMCGWPHDVEICPNHLVPLSVCDEWDGGHEGDDACHCGQPVRYGYDDDPTRHRGMCAHCDLVRCDAYPGECGR